MKFITKTLVGGAALSFVLNGMADDLSLTEDQTVHVEAGQTLEYDALTGGEFTLTKTGAGTLQFKALDNPAAAIVVEGGTVKVAGETVTPSVLESAAIWMDAGRDAFTTTAGQDAPTGWDGAVSRWQATGGSSSGVMNGLNPLFRPFLVPGAKTVSGLPLVDFGSQRKQDSEGLMVPGQGGYAILSERDSSTHAKQTGLLEVMVVASDTEDVKTTIADNKLGSGTESTRATPFVGSDATTGQICFGRCGRSESGVNSGIQNKGSSFDYAAKGVITLDGVVTTAETPYPDGLHLLEFQPTEGVSVVYLASDRVRWCGGVRIGAVVAFKTRLSDADRRALRRYLLTRWVPAPLRRLELKDGATLAFENAAGVHAGTLAYSGSSSLSGGSLTCDAEEGASGTIAPTSGKWLYGVGARGRLPSCAGNGCDVAWYGGWQSRAAFTLSATPWFHVDASAATTVTAAETDGTNFISSWVDADGGAVYARTETGRKPFLRKGFLNGRDVVDFGAFSINYQTPGGWGGSQTWHDRKSGNAVSCSNVREVLTVAADTEDLVDNYENIRDTAGDYSSHVGRGAPFIGNASNNPHFIRGKRADLETGIPILLTSVKPYATASVRLDGADVAKDAPYPNGFHVVDIRSGQNGCNADCFARDRSYIFGGTRIAEFYLFESELSDADREGLTSRLMTKWLGADPTDVVAFENLTVGAAANVSASESKYVVAKDFALAGKLSLGALEAHARAAFSANAVFSGMLKLADGATLALDGVSPTATEPARTFDRLALDGGSVTIDFTGSRRDYCGHRVPILGAKALKGSATFVAGGVLADNETTFEWEDGVLYATAKPNGLMLIFR